MSDGSESGASIKRLKIRVGRNNYCIAKFKPGFSIGRILDELRCTNEFFSVTVTEFDLSVVFSENNLSRDILADGDMQIEREWTLFQVEGQLDFDMVGVIAGFSKLFADQDIPIFCFSTFDTDYFLIKNINSSKAMSALDQHQISWTKSHA